MRIEPGVRRVPDAAACDGRADADAGARHEAANNVRADADAGARHEAADVRACHRR